MNKSVAFPLVLLALLAHLTTAVGGTGGPKGGETLYNGIQLPEQWPPQCNELSLEQAVVPYLTNPPQVIPIDIGRQLFVDDFLIESTTLERSFHLPTYHPASPVLKPDKPWECEKRGKGQGPFAMPFSDGVFYNPQDRLFKMWYHADYGSPHLCYATSVDGVSWEKPRLDVVPDTNIAFPRPGGERVVWLDPDEKNPGKRYKMVVTRGGDDLLKPDDAWWGSRCSQYVFFSADGIQWNDKPAARTGPCGDRNSAFYNPFRKVWVYSIREYRPFGGIASPMRCRRYFESPDLVTGLPWKYGEPPLWVGADNLDRRLEYPEIPELYTLDAVAYESVLLGLFSILRHGADLAAFRPKINEVCVGFSRDGFHWSRPDRRSFLPVSENKEDWNWGNVQSVGGCCLIVGDQLWFYCSGRRGDAPFFHDAGGSTGLAVLRRDGFASMDAGDQGGVLTTRPVRFSGRYLFVNLNTDRGELRAEVLDGKGQAIAPFTCGNCLPARTDKTLFRLAWKGASDLGTLSGRAVRFRFHVQNGSLYAFWVSPSRSGASHGYVAGGGPGFTGPTDTVGAAALHPQDFSFICPVQIQALSHLNRGRTIASGYRSITWLVR
ncbi:MAG: glycosyl hydrolase family 32 [Candidatus Omnitrophica bacterium]|nr:glycosyl hydrolase family 32 [Candidatus Omnitrophota bacterium]